MSTSKNLKLTTWLGGLLTPQFLSTALAVAVTAVLLPVGKSAAWGGGSENNEGAADRGAVRLLKTIPIPGPHSIRPAANYTPSASAGSVSTAEPTISPIVPIWRLTSSTPRLANSWRSCRQGSLAFVRAPVPPAPTA
jgi:hypothetical protein